MSNLWQHFTFYIWLTNQVEIFPGDFFMRVTIMKLIKKIDEFHIYIFSSRQIIWNLKARSVIYKKNVRNSNSSIYISNDLPSKIMQTWNSSRNKLITFWDWKVQKQNKIIYSWSCENEKYRWLSSGKLLEMQCSSAIFVHFSNKSHSFVVSQIICFKNIKPESHLFYCTLRIWYIHSTVSTDYTSCILWLAYWLATSQVRRQLKIIRK